MHSSLGSIIVLVIVTLGRDRLPLLARQPMAAWLLLVAVFGGIALVTCSEAVFARPRPKYSAASGAGLSRKLPERPRVASPQSLI